MTNFTALSRVQTVFALAGLLVLAASQAFLPGDHSLLAWSLSGAFLAFVLYAAKELKRGTRRGIILSLIAQASQIVHINLGSVSVLFLAGPFVELGASRSIVALSWGAGAVASLDHTVWLRTMHAGTYLAMHHMFIIDTQAATRTIAIGLNVVALVFAVHLWRAWRGPRPKAPEAPSFPPAV